MNKVVKTIKTDYVHLYKVVNFYTDNLIKTIYYFKDGMKCKDRKFINKHVIKNEFISDEDLQRARQNSLNKRESDYDKLIDILKEKWMSNYEIQQFLKSSSGDRTMRKIRKFPPIGYIVDSRNKDVPKGYNKCLEYKLIKV